MTTVTVVCQSSSHVVWHNLLPKAQYPTTTIDADLLVILPRHSLAPRWNYPSVPRSAANHRRFGTELAARNLHASMILGWSTFPKCSLSRASGLFVDNIIIRVAHDNIMYPYPGGILLVLAVACLIACEFCEKYGIIKIFISNA